MQNNQKNIFFFFFKKYKLCPINKSKNSDKHINQQNIEEHEENEEEEEEEENEYDDDGTGEIFLSQLEEDPNNLT